MKPELRILHVEDNRAIARLLIEQLKDVKDISTAVVWVELLSAAVAALRDPACAVDVVLLDLALPDGLGIEVVDRLRAAAPSLPIVVFTALGDDLLTTQVRAHGAQACLVKGEAGGKEIVATIQDAMAQWPPRPV
jgi:CheY-like chemotaxis protein